VSGPTAAVFDCNVLLQALASPGGPAGRCVQFALGGRVHLFVSPAVIRELADVASRPKVVAKLHLVRDRVDAFIESVGAAATLLADFPEPFQYARDPDDALYVNLALAAGARRIVSRDRDLLDLMVLNDDESGRFRERFPELQIVNPVGFLDELR
jgi:putative PIN family toxin of toxin-antitoxin system